VTFLEGHLLDPAMKDKYHIIYIVIIVIFAGTTIWWVMHSYEHDSAAEHYTQHVKDYPLLDPALPFYEKDNLIVNIQELREYLKALPEQNKDWAEMSIYFEVMNTGANVTVNNDVKLWPASLAKLPVAMIAMEKVEQGHWTLDTEFTIEPADADTENNPQIRQDIGKKFPLKVVLEKLLLNSDNTAYKILIRNLTEEELTAIAEEVGLEVFFIPDGKVSAKDYTRLLRSLYLATYLSKEHSMYLLDLISTGKFNKFLRAGVPENVKLAHKWGINEDQNAYADSGIVYIKGRPYMISVIIKGNLQNQKDNQQKAEALIKEVAERSYNFMKEQ
jgi:beta-lactamase class A